MAPVDTMDCDQAWHKEADPKVSLMALFLLLS